MTDSRTLTDVRQQALITIDELLERTAAEPHLFIEVGREAGGSPALRAATRLSLDDFSGSIDAATGRRPLPAHATIVDLLSRHGAGADTPVVIYASTSRDLSAAARAWVVLTWAGFTRISYLNGAFADDLTAVESQLGATPPAPTPTSPTTPRELIVNPSVVVDSTEVSGRADDVILVDARRSDAYGDSTQHIAGAVNLPSSLLTTEGRIRPGAEIAAEYTAALGVDPSTRPLILYCGSGVSASVQALALASIGVRAPVYIGSWSEWSSLSETSQ